MAGLILPNRFTHQPQFPVGLDRANPIASGLRSAFSPAMGIMIDTYQNNSVISTADTGAQRVGEAGISRYYSPGGKSTFANSPRYQLTGEMTLVLIFDIDALTNFGALISCQDTTTTNGFELRLGTIATNSFILMNRANTGPRQTTTNSNRLSAGTKNNFLAVTCQAPIESLPTFYVNGAAYAGVDYAGAGTGAQGAPSVGTLNIGARAAGTTQLDGAVLFAALWSRVLSASEVESVRRNHAQVYQAPYRRGLARVGFRAAYVRGINSVINAGNAG